MCLADNYVDMDTHFFLERRPTHLRWKTAWNRPTVYMFILIGIAVAIFGFIVVQQSFLRIVFIAVGVIYVVAFCIFLFLAYRR